MPNGVRGEIAGLNAVQQSASIERLAHVLFGAETSQVIQFWLSRWRGEDCLPLWAEFALGGATGGSAGRAEPSTDLIFRIAPLGGRCQKACRAVRA
jgi:hypothetical protein